MVERGKGQTESLCSKAKIALVTANKVSVSGFLIVRGTGNRHVN